MDKYVIIDLLMELSRYFNGK